MSLTMAQISVPPIPQPAPRTCCQCGCFDHVQIHVIDGEYVESHFVKIETQFLADMGGMKRVEDQTDPVKLLRLKRKGWERFVFEGKPAMRRMVCVNCLNANERSKKIWAELHEQALKLERRQNAEENFYHILCEVDEEG